MKLIVLGATGSTGLEIVRQAMNTVIPLQRLFARRSDSSRFATHPHQKKEIWLDTSQLEHVIKAMMQFCRHSGHGCRYREWTKKLLQQFAVALTTAMLRSGVRRVVIESVAFLFKHAIIPPAYLLGRLFFPGRRCGRLRMENVLEKSDSTGQSRVHLT